jgi:hypothetical protein
MIFGTPRQKGISDYELRAKGGRLMGRMSSGFEGSRATRQRKRNLLDAAFAMTGDKDYGSSHHQGGLTSKEEFDHMLKNYQEKGIFSEREVSHIRKAANDALNN